MTRVGRDRPFVSAAWECVAAEGSRSWARPRGANEMGPVSTRPPRNGSFWRKDVAGGAVVGAEMAADWGH